MLALWFVGGLLSFCGAVGYAELATTYPEQGGDYVYLTKAYGRWAGFLFGWLQTLVVRPGDIAVMAFVFATYAENLVGHRWIGKPGPRGGGGRCAHGCQRCRRTQRGAHANVLTVAKVVGVSLVIVVAVLGPGAEAAPVEELSPEQPVPLAIALVLVLFSFGGWNETAFVAAEVREPRRNIVRAMVLGMAVVTVIYLAVNASFLHVLGFHGLASSEAVAAETVASVFPEAAGSMVSALICLCALGAVNGLVFAGARIAYAVGRDHRLFGALGRWSERTGTPVRALIRPGKPVGGPDPGPRLVYRHRDVHRSRGLPLLPRDQRCGHRAPVPGSVGPASLQGHRLPGDHGRLLSRMPVPDCRVRPIPAMDRGGRGSVDPARGSGVLAQ